MRVDFNRPYDFEGKTYDGLDIAIEGLSGKDVMVLEEDFKQSLPARSDMRMLGFSVLQFRDEFLLFAAARYSGQPLEFIEGLPLGDFAQVVAAVQGFFTNS